MANNYDDLRRELMDYYGTAMCSGFPMAVVELSDVENASNDELIRMAKKAGISTDSMDDIF